MMHASKKIPAKRITVFAIYHKFTLFGEFGRAFVTAFPSLCMAEKWIKDQNETDPILNEDRYMIEEFSGWMKAWQP